MLIEDVLTGISKIEKIDLRGSKINWKSLKELILENKEHLKDLALPKGCSDEQLETLLLYLPSLEKLTVQSPQGTEQWLQCLPQTMEILDISDCPDLTANGLLHVSRLTKLENLTLHGVPAGVITDAGRDGLNGPDTGWWRWRVKTPGGDTGRWLQKLPESLQTLVISGPDGSEMEWNLKGDWGWPSATICHATDSTLAFLTGLADRLKKLTITESPLVTASGLLHVGRLTKLENLTLHGVSAGVTTDAWRDGPEDTGRWLQKLPESLVNLVIGGPDGSEMKYSDLKGWPTATIRHATDSTLALLTGLADRLERLYIEESPLVTASGLLHVGRFTKLWSLILHGVSAGSITDAVLDGLNSCSRLFHLQLGDKDQPPQTAITAAAVCRLAVACRRLRLLYLHTTADSSQAVLDGLHRTDLGSDSDGQRRYISLWVPGPVLSQLRRPPSDSRIWVEDW